MPTKPITRLECTCSRCGYVWATKTDKKPKVCANIRCKSPYWNTERRIKKEGK